MSANGATRKNLKMAIEKYIARIQELEKKVNYFAGESDARLMSYEIAVEDHKQEVNRLLLRAERAEARNKQLEKKVKELRAGNIRIIKFLAKRNLGTRKG